VTSTELSEHLARIGARGGQKNSPAQRRARRINAYRSILKRWPNSVSARQELTRLEQEREATSDRG
jgi:hypothetical protein